MPKLIGPMYEENFWDPQDPLWRRYRMPRGITLAVKGTAVTELVYPYLDEFDKGVWDIIYAGGHIHPLTNAQAQVLINAGYGQYVFPD